MKPILFNTEMVKAILEDRKTVTRRIVKPQPISSMFTGVCTGSTMRNDKTVGRFMFGDNYGEVKEHAKPPYKVGDILYVRETWCYGANTVECLFNESIKCNDIFYKASWDKENYVKWRPSIHMPAEAARIFLKVTSVRVERLQNITAEQVLKEGIRGYTKDGELYKYAVSDDWWIDYHRTHKKEFKGTYWQDMPKNPTVAYSYLWNSTIRKNDHEAMYKYGWKANPWVWVIEFERVEKQNI